MNDLRDLRDLNDLNDLEDDQQLQNIPVREPRLLWERRNPLIDISDLEFR